MIWCIFRLMINLFYTSSLLLFWLLVILDIGIVGDDNDINDDGVIAVSAIIIVPSDDVDIQFDDDGELSISDIIVMSRCDDDIVVVDVDNWWLQQLLLLSAGVDGPADDVIGDDSLSATIQPRSIPAKWFIGFCDRENGCHIYAFTHKFTTNTTTTTTYTHHYKVLFKYFFNWFNLLFCLAIRICFFFLIFNIIKLGWTLINIYFLVKL